MKVIVGAVLCGVGLFLISYAFASFVARRLGPKIYDKIMEDIGNETR